MAWECQEILEDSPTKNNSITNPWNEEPLLPSIKFHAPYPIPKSNCTKNPKNKSLSPRPTFHFASKKGTSSPIRATGDDFDGRAHRTFADLPPALVSEILQCLDAKELGIVSCVSTLLHSIASDHQSWRDFYLERWGSPPCSDPCAKSWKELFVEREFRTKSFMGRFRIDTLRGHTEAVRAVFLLPSANLIFTGGYDSVIRMWDMEDGLSVACSRPLGCTIRAVTADADLLVVGGTGAFLQCWPVVDGHPNRFDIAGSSSRLWGHEGPVTCLALDSTKIYSGSWDMSVRLWDRAQLNCLKTLRHGDWVWALAPCGSTVASSAGRDVYVWDTESGDPVTVIYNAHSGNAQSLARSRSGDILFTGGEDGAVHMFEVNGRVDDEGGIKPSATWVPHSGPVLSLAFEFPWLVSSSSDGRIALIDVRKLLSSSRMCSRVKMVAVAKTSGVEPPQRMLHGFGCNLFSVDIGADRIVCGGEEGVVRVWNFSEALEIEKRVQALKSVRLENRARRRKAQMEMKGDRGRADQCSIAATKRNQLDGDCNGIWHGKRVGGKVKA